MEIKNKLIKWAVRIIFNKQIQYIFSELEITEDFYQIEYKNNKNAEYAVKKQLIKEIAYQLLKNQLISIEIRTNSKYGRTVKANLSLKI